MLSLPDHRDELHADGHSRVQAASTSDGVMPSDVKSARDAGPRREGIRREAGDLVGYKQNEEDEHQGPDALSNQVANQKLGILSHLKIYFKGKVRGIDFADSSHAKQRPEDPAENLPDPIDHGSGDWEPIVLRYKPSIINADTHGHRWIDVSPAERAAENDGDE